MKKYIVLEQIIEFPDEIDEQDVDYFIDQYLDLVDNFGTVSGGTFMAMTEEELHEYQEDK